MLRNVTQPERNEDAAVDLLRHKRPMMTVESAKGILDKSEDEVLGLIECGALVAWNISTPRRVRREFRILTKSVGMAQARPTGALDHPLFIPEPEIFMLLMPHVRVTVTGVEIQHILNCGSTHVIRLVEARCLAQAPGSDYHRGPHGSPRIQRASLEEFLRTRLEGAV